MTFNSDVLANNWKQLRSKLKQKWMALTEDDLKTIDGSADVLVDILQEKYSSSRQWAEMEVTHFLEEIEGQPAAQS